MEILIGICLALVLLYFWLTGHWFARVVMLPVCALPLGLGVCTLFVAAANNGPQQNAAGVFGFLIGLALAWPVSGIPIYYHRWRALQTLRVGVPFA